MRMPPIKRTPGKPSSGGWKRHREIHRGTAPATTPGAMTRKAALPRMAKTLRIELSAMTGSSSVTEEWLKRVGRQLRAPLIDLPRPKLRSGFTRLRPAPPRCSPARPGQAHVRRDLAHDQLARSGAGVPARNRASVDGGLSREGPL